MFEFNKIKEQLINENKTIIDLLKDEQNQKLKNDIEFELFNNANILEYDINLEFIYYNIKDEELFNEEEKEKYVKLFSNLKTNNIVVITNNNELYKEKIMYLNSKNYYILLISDNREDLKLKYDFENLFVLIKKEPLTFIKKKQNINIIDIDFDNF